MNILRSTFRKGFFAMITMGFLALTSPAQAVTLNTAGGQLLGASGVNVNGNLFDVEFLDGTCASLFDGCDSVTDFTFVTDAEAITAAQALLDSVFLGRFDWNPILTYGISTNVTANVIIPYFLINISPPFTGVMGIVAQNRANINPDFVTSSGFILPQTTTSYDAYAVFARFTPTPLSVVPLPPAGVLFGSGLVFLALLRRRAKKLAHA